MQGAEDEVEGSVLTYVTKTEFRKQRSRSPSCNSLIRDFPEEWAAWVGVTLSVGRLDGATLLLVFRFLFFRMS